MGVLIERLILRPLHNAPVLSIIVVFIGLLAIFNSMAGAIWSYLIKEFPSPFPKSSFGIAGVIGPHQLGVVLVTLIVLALLFVFFRYTPLGLAMRAAAQNPQMARLVGVRVDWMLALGWGLAASVGAVAGIMVAHIVYLDPNMMGGILLYAFASALVGGISNPGGRGGRRLHRRRAREHGGLRRQPDREGDRHLHHRQRREAHGGADHRHHRADAEARRPVRPRRREEGLTWPRSRRSGCWVLIALAVLVPLLQPVFPDVVSDYRLFLVSTMIIAAIAVLGLNLLTGFNGQISLGHGAFYAVGAYTAAVLMDKLNVPYWATIPAAAIVCFIVGYLFGLPALKLEGHYLALATFALALAVPQILKYKWLEGLTGGVQGIVLMKPEAPFGLPLQRRPVALLFLPDRHDRAVLGARPTC